MKCRATDEKPMRTLQIQDLMQRATQHWPVGSFAAIAAAFLLLGAP